MSHTSSMKGRLTRLLLPLVSAKSWRVIALGSTWCSRKPLMKPGPMIGISEDPKLSARKCTNPEIKSAAKYARTAITGRSHRYPKVVIPW
jgi:hypothetical protein